MSHEAGEGWDRFVDANGVTFSALLEAAGRILHDGRPALHSDEVVELARAIDRERAKRR